VTLFQASLEKREPTMADTMPAKTAAPPMDTDVPVPASQRRVSQAADQLASHTASLKPTDNPITVNPPSERILIKVNNVWMIFPFRTPRELIHVRRTMVAIATN